MKKMEEGFPESSTRMPALFVGHGNPMNAVEDNEFSRAWTAAGRDLPEPRAILSISAHWETHGPKVTIAAKPETIHDFFGFPEELYRQSYSAPGSPSLAALVRKVVREVPITGDPDWGLDHGTWSVLKRMFPRADIPVVQLSLDRTQGPAFHYGLGRALRPLRNRGILILGSGNIVHNLALMDGQGGAYPWAKEFDGDVWRSVEAGDHAPLINYHKLGRPAQLAVPTHEHYLPMLYILGLQEDGEKARTLVEGIDLRSVSMRSFRLG